MSELIEMLEDFIEVVEADEYPIDKVIMSKERCTLYVNILKRSLNTMTRNIKTEFPDITDFKYRRFIFPYRPSPNEKGTITQDGEEWEIMKSSEYEPGGFEVFLKREK